MLQQPDPRILLLLLVLAGVLFLATRMLRIKHPSGDWVGPPSDMEGHAEAQSTIDPVALEWRLCPFCRGTMRYDLLWRSFCPFCGRSLVDGLSGEEYAVSSERLVEKVEDLVRQGNVERIVVKDESGAVLVEVPVDRRVGEALDMVGPGATLNRLRVLTELSVQAPRFVVAVQRFRDKR
jgi:hypothetical protein